jgi:hypothetical protein
MTPVAQCAVNAALPGWHVPLCANNTPNTLHVHTCRPEPRITAAAHTCRAACLAVGVLQTRLARHARHKVVDLVALTWNTSTDELGTTTSDGTAQLTRARDVVAQPVPAVTLLALASDRVCRLAIL